MAAVSLKQFVGMTPRQPDHLLPDNGASLAKDCDFSRGQLGPLKGGYDVTPSGVTPDMTVRSMYTVAGLHWYTWQNELTAYKSPVIDEVYNRIYYIEGGVMKVALGPEPPQSAHGGPPVAGVIWNVGVPNPTVAPVLTLIDRNRLADYPAASLEFKAWWTDGMKNFDPVVVGAVPYPPGSEWKRYALGTLPTPPVATPPADGEEAPAAVVYTLIVQATATEDQKRLFQMTTVLNSTTPSRSAALPGGITMTLETISEPGTPENPAGFYINFEWGVVETRAYTYTMVNTWNEESGPSPVALISPTYLQDVKVGCAFPSFTGFRPYKQTNVYRTYGGPQYIKAGHFDSGSEFIEEARTVQADTGTALPSLTWVPPVASMGGLVLAPNGWFLAFKGNTLYMSEPYRPHSWPYSMTFAKAILGICVGAQSIVVTTYDATYLVSGPHPASVTSMTLSIPVGGISQRSMCVIEGGVAFLSNDGLVIVEGSQATLESSQRYFTREVWRALFGAALDTMSLAYHDGCVIATSMAQATGFIIELDEAGGAMTRYDYQHTALMRLPSLDTLYYATPATSPANPTGTKIYRFREGTHLDAEWRSKQFLSPSYNKFGIGFARMSGDGTITVELLADGTHVHTEVLNAADLTKYFRLPPQHGSLKWQLRINVAGNCKLEDMAFAHTVEELKGV